MSVTQFLFAVSVSLDALSIGTAYGIKGIKITPLSKWIISGFSVLYAAAAIWLGGFLGGMLPARCGEKFSGALLALIAVYTLLGALRKRRNPSAAKRTPPKRSRFRLIRPIGVSVTIARHPAAADFDRSRSIDKREALYVALALSLDALGAGAGYGMGSGDDLLLPVLIGGFQFLFLSVGGILGRRISHIPRLGGAAAEILPGILLLILAIMKLY